MSTSSARFVSAFAALISMMTPGVRADDVRRVSLDSYGGDSNGHSLSPVVSDSEKFIAFASAATDLTPEADNNGAVDIFLRVFDFTKRISKDIYGGDANGSSGSPAISGDGRFVAFQSYASNLVKSDTNGSIDIFVYDREKDSIERVNLTSSGTQSAGSAFAPSISGDGRRVTFFTPVALVPEDTNGLPDVYVRDRINGTTTRVSVGPGGVSGSGFSNFSAISADGRYVAFQSTSSNLVANDTNASFDIFLRDLDTETTERVSVDSKEKPYGWHSNFPAISGNGRYVIFESGLGFTQVLVRDRVKGTTKLVSRNKNGAPGNGNSGAAKISRDGKYIAFRTEATDLVKNDVNGSSDVLRCKRSGKQMRLVSAGPSVQSALGTSDTPAIDATGSHVVFQSDAEDLVFGDKNFAQDIFVRSP